MDGLQGVSQGSVTVLVACPPSLVRYGLRSVLQTMRPGWAVSEADTLDMTIDVLGHYTPDVVLVDVNLPGMDDAAALRRIADHMTAPRTLVLADDGNRSEILHWIDNGAQGYLTKSAAGTQVVCAIETVLFGGIFAPASLSARPDPAAQPQRHTVTHAAASPIAVAAGRTVDLTERQRAVLELVLEGYNTKMIARQLNIAVATAKVHLAAVYRMLGARNRSEAIIKTTRGLAAAQRPTDESTAAPATGRQITWTVHEGRAQPRRPEAPAGVRRIDGIAKSTTPAVGRAPTASAV